MYVSPLPKQTVVLKSALQFIYRNTTLNESAWSQRSLTNSFVPISSFYAYCCCKVQHPHNNLFGPAGGYLAFMTL